jgi:glycosyltransferase involved in cell wall biosynthesis
MRIGLDVRLPYYTRGGISKYIWNLARALPTLAPEYAHFHFYRRGHAQTFSARARRVDCWTPAHHPLEALTLSGEIAPYRLDLLHSPDFIPPLVGGRRTVITVHDLTFLLHPEFLTATSRRYYNGQIERAVKQAHAIAADSQATKDDLGRLLNVPPDKVTVIHLGLDADYHPLAVDEFSPTLTRLNLAPGYLLCVGTFEPRKNVPGLLRAYAQLRQRFPAAPSLVLVGNKGWLFGDAVALMLELKIESQVRVLENLPAPDLPAVYNGAGALALVSHYEGFGFPVLEAMGCGVPCVIADRASLPEIAGDAALQVNPDDTEAISAALYRALSDSALRESLRVKGLERVQHFTWEKTARETLALYARVLQE